MKITVRRLKSLIRETLNQGSLIRESSFRIKKRGKSLYSTTTEPYLLKDLEQDLPEEAAAAKRDVHDAENADFDVKNGDGPLICHVTNGDSAVWYEYQNSSQSWIRKKPWLNI